MGLFKGKKKAKTEAEQVAEDYNIIGKDKRIHPDEGGQPPVIMGQPQMPQIVQGGQPPVIVQGEPSKLAEF